MNTLAKIHEITMRLDHIENSSEWLARALVHVDGPASQTGSLITTLAEDVRERLLALIAELEEQLSGVKPELH